MKLFYQIAADSVVVFHSAFVLFVVAGLCLILLGVWRKWNWIRNFWFRIIHLAMIGSVVAEAWCGITCPLTIWEKELRRLAGEATYQGDFLANWVHDLLFFDISEWVFTVIYSLFGLVVAATFFLAPPHFPHRKSKSA